MGINQFAHDLVVVLIAGTVAGIVCKKLSISLLVGYLVVGAFIGGGVLGLVDHPQGELELIAEGGALFLLFSIGIEFSIPELKRLQRFFLVGGTTQMLFTAVPLAVVAHWFGMSWGAALLAGAAGAFSSTVIVFRAISEEGQMHLPHGRGAVGVLLFQDAALVPLLLLVPLITGEGIAPTTGDYIALFVKAATFLLGILLLHGLMAIHTAAWLARLRSVEILALVALTLLCGLCFVAYLLGLPAAVGAFAAGLVLSGHRITKQIDAIVLPFRETFAAVFFVSLGMLMRPAIFIAEPMLLSGGVVGILLLKSLAAGVALRLVGLPWKAALGTGLGLAQLGEFSFLLISRAANTGVISDDNYNRMLFIGVVTLVATPLLIRYGFRLAAGLEDRTTASGMYRENHQSRAVVVGLGIIGGRVAAHLETCGIQVALVDLSPINLHLFAQAGFATFAGDARDAVTLETAGAHVSELAVVCVPDDEIARQVVVALRRANSAMSIVVRCRFQATTTKLYQAGANAVISEEVEATGPLLAKCSALIDGALTTNR